MSTVSATHEHHQTHSKGNQRFLNGDTWRNPQPNPDSFCNSCQISRQSGRLCKDFEDLCSRMTFSWAHVDHSTRLAVSNHRSCVLYTTDYWPTLTRLQKRLVSVTNITKQCMQILFQYQTYNYINIIHAHMLFYGTFSRYIWVMRCSHGIFMSQMSFLPLIYNVKALQETQWFGHLLFYSHDFSTPFLTNSVKALKETTLTLH